MSSPALSGERLLQANDAAIDDLLSEARDSADRMLTGTT
jgi:hypothetical protein